MGKLGWALLLLISIVAPSSAVFAGQLPALVVVAQDQNPKADERDLLDRINTTMVRNSTRGRYGSTAFLTEKLANKFTLMRTISHLVRAGREVDVFVLAPGAEDRIQLLSGELTASELAATLKPLKTEQPGHVRLVYFVGGRTMADAWSDVGATAVLAQPSVGEFDEPAPFFLPRFLKAWGTGASATEAAASGLEFSNAALAKLSKFVDRQALEEHVVAPAPIFLGRDVNVAGREKALPKTLGDVHWPAKTPARQEFTHTALREGVLKSLARLLTNRFEFEAKSIPGIQDLVNEAGGIGWDTLHAIFPGRGANEIVLPGSDVRIILSRMLPGLDNYMGRLIDNLETMVVTKNDGKLVADIWLTGKELRFDIRKEDDCKTGQPYAVILGTHSHFELYSMRDSITIDAINGIKAMLKLPVVPDGVSPTKLKLDTATETLTIAADAIGGVVHVIATADVRAREFKGVDWLATMMKNLPLLFSLLFFSPF